MLTFFVFSSTFQVHCCHWIKRIKIRFQGIPCTNGHIVMPHTIKFTKFVFLVKLAYINLNQEVQKKGISTPKLQKGENFILTIYYYLTVNVLHNIVISPLFLWSWNPTFLEALMNTCTLKLKHIWLTRHTKLVICTRDTLSFEFYVHIW